MIEMGLFIMLPVLLCTIVIKHTLIVLSWKHHLIMNTPLISSNPSYPIIIDGQKGQNDYKSCKVQNHTTTPPPPLNQRKGEFTGCNKFN
jgi:hypothetical protein